MATYGNFSLRSSRVSWWRRGSCPFWKGLPRGGRDGEQGLSTSFTIGQVRKDVNSRLRMLGAVSNLYKPQRNLSAESRQGRGGRR